MNYHFELDMLSDGLKKQIFFLTQRKIYYCNPMQARLSSDVILMKTMNICIRQNASKNEYENILIDTDIFFLTRD